MFLFHPTVPVQRSAAVLTSCGPSVNTAWGLSHSYAAFIPTGVIFIYQRSPLLGVCAWARVCVFSTRMRRQWEENSWWAGMVENTDRTRHPNTRMNLRGKHTDWVLAKNSVCLINIQFGLLQLTKANSGQTVSNTIRMIKVELCCVMLILSPIYLSWWRKTTSCCCEPSLGHKYV